VRVKKCIDQSGRWLQDCKQIASTENDSLDVFDKESEAEYDMQSEEEHSSGVHENTSEVKESALGTGPMANSGEVHLCQLSRIIRESPGYGTNLPVSRTGD